MKRVSASVSAGRCLLAAALCSSLSMNHNVGQTSGQPKPAPVAVKAFPTAEGFGARAVGGRGGQVIEVTTLDDSGPGSLRAAMEASGPRIVVFRVSGTITLTNAIRVRTPYLTVAGQTLPGGGESRGNGQPEGDCEFGASTALTTSFCGICACALAAT